MNPAVPVPVDRPPAGTSSAVEALPMFPSSRYDVVVFAASLGGFRVLREILPLLPADFPASVVVMLHHGGHARCTLGEMFARDVRLDVDAAGIGEAPRARTIHFVCGERHVVLDEKRRFATIDGEREHFVRPAADPMFRSLAARVGSRAVGVVLSGNGRDGALGAQAIRAAGGIVIAQDAASAEAGSMPRATIDLGAADHVLPPAAIARALVALTLVPGASDLFRVAR